MRALIAGIGVTLMATVVPADAQTIGTFAWKLDPFCDVVTFTVTADGPAFRLSGFDQPCGGARVPAAGIVVPNPDGTFTLAFYLVTAQGLSSHTTATLAPGTYSGPWRDALGQTGTLSFGSGPGGGTPRPVAALQQRVAGACTGSEFVQKVREDGSVECGAAPAGNSGDITGVAAGAGLSGGGGAGEVTLAIAPDGVGSAQIADGSIGAADIDASQVQRRVGNHCGAGLYATSINANGLLLCAAGTASNTALGQVALAVSTATGNTAVGANAMLNTTTGGFNTAVGYWALRNNTTALANTAIGANALRDNTIGHGNTGVGLDTLLRNTTGSSNVALGNSALDQNTTGESNVAIGRSALSSSMTAWDNVAVGASALSSSVTARYNTAVGTRALWLADGSQNAVVGWRSGYAMTTGSDNTAIGYATLPDLTTGTHNIAIGTQAGGNLTTGSDNIHIGYQGGANEDNTIRIGVAQDRAFITGIRGITTGGGGAVAVLVDGHGQLGTVSSSRRTKEDIHDMGSASAGVFRLRPVTFRYRRPYADGSKPTDYGLIAEEVAEVYPDLVARNQAGEIETVQYHKLTPMLLNELQRLRLEVEALRDRVAELEGRR